MKFTWLLADPPPITTEGRTDNGGTASIVIIIHSGRARLGSMPRISDSSSLILCDAFILINVEQQIPVMVFVLQTYRYNIFTLNISYTRSAVSGIFFSWESSLTCFHSATRSKPSRFIFGWYRPQPPCPALKFIIGFEIQGKKKKLSTEASTNHYRPFILPSSKNLN